MERKFILSEKKLDELDNYTKMYVKETYHWTDEQKDAMKQLGLPVKETQVTSQEVKAIYKGEFLSILFTEKGHFYNIYLVKPMFTHCTYRNVFGSKRHGTKRNGYEVFASRMVKSKDEVNEIYRGLLKRIFKSKNDAYFVKIDEL